MNLLGIMAEKLRNGVETAIKKRKRQFTSVTSFSKAEVEDWKSAECETRLRIITTTKKIIG